MPRIKVRRGDSIFSIAKRLGLPASNAARVRDFLRRAGLDPNNLRTGQQGRASIDLGRVGGGRATTAIAGQLGISPTGAPQGAGGIAQGIGGPQASLDTQVVQGLGQPPAEGGRGGDPTSQINAPRSGSGLPPSIGGRGVDPTDAILAPRGGGEFQGTTPEATGSLRGFAQTPGSRAQPGGFGLVDSSAQRFAGAAGASNPAPTQQFQPSVQQTQSLSGAVAQDTRMDGFGSITQVAGAPLQDPAAVEATINDNAQQLLNGNPHPVVPASTAQYLQTLDPEIYGAMLYGGYKLQPGGELRYDPDFAVPGATSSTFGGFSSNYTSRGGGRGGRGGGMKKNFSQAMGGLINWRIGFG